MAIDLKKGVFQPEHAGRMNVYLVVLDDQVLELGENASIGLILCRKRNLVVV